MLRFEKVSYHHPGAAPEEAALLHEISLTLEAGQLLWVFGASGSGKTTLLRLAHGAVRPTSGVLSFQDQPLDAMSRDQLASLRRRVALVEAVPRLLRGQSLLENVALPLRLAGEAEDFSLRRAREVMADVGVMHKANRRPHEVSPGDRQRACLARALACAPSVLLLDEPTALLDRDLALQGLKLVREARERGVACLVVSHDPSLRWDKSEQARWLRDGRLTDAGEMP